jgi:hypothetical protein
MPGQDGGSAWRPGRRGGWLPLATGAAILRYRLYDLDRIVSRTLACGLLTLLLGGGYAGVVLGLGQLLGRDSSLVVAGATLAVAAAFQPARHRIQQAVDRRFNRRRYDAARTIQAFSDRLRQQVDLDTLTAELLAVVEQSMQPTQASLWRRPWAAAPAPWPRTTDPLPDGSGPAGVHDDGDAQQADGGADEVPPVGPKPVQRPRPRRATRRRTPRRRRRGCARNGRPAGRSQRSRRRRAPARRRRPTVPPGAPGPPATRARRPRSPPEPPA